MPMGTSESKLGFFSCFVFRVQPLQSKPKVEMIMAGVDEPLWGSQVE